MSATGTSQHAATRDATGTEGVQRVPGHARTTLFVRLFLGFFVVSALVLVATFYLTQRAEIPEDLLVEHAPQIVQDLLEAERRNSKRALDETHDRIRNQLRINAYLASDGKSLSLRPMPPPVLETLGNLPAGREARFQFGASGRMFAIPVQLSNAKAAHAVLFVHHDRDPATSRRSLLYWQLLALLGAAAALGWFVARALTAPIRRMQVAVNRVAGGDLGSRVGNTLETGIGELDELASDIDHMASQMQAMMTTRDRLLHHLSHEIRSPLARLRILLEFLRDSDQRTEDVQTRSARLDKADREVGRIDALVDEILNLARLDGSKPPPMSPTSLEEIIDECMESASVEAEAKGVHLSRSVEAPKGHDMISGNRELLVRAVDNLLRNAIHHAPANGRVNISVSTRSDDASARLTVVDDGPGVPDEYLSHIFEPFFRLPHAAGEMAANQQERKGYGLGLTFVRLVATLHQATLVATNQAPHGLSISIGFAAMDQRRRDADKSQTG
jgi:two-component system, OmpR family, sensor kinase